MGQKGKKKEKIKQDPWSNAAKMADNPDLWPDLPHQLVHLIRWEPNLFSDIGYKGVIKSVRTESKRSCSANPIPPWLELFHDGQAEQPQMSAITLKGPDFRCWMRTWKKYDDELYLLGSSHGYQVNKEHLWNPVKRLRTSLPEWNARIPFLFTFMSSFDFPKEPKSIVLALTGISNPAFLFFREFQVGYHVERAWKKEDCTIVDPHCSNPFDRHHFMRFTNAMGFKGKFYALSLQGTLAVIEEIDSQLRITALGKKRAIPSVPSMHFRECLVESDGDILLIFLISRKSSFNSVDEVEVYRLDIDRLIWIKVDSLGDRTLFLGSNCTISVSASQVGCWRDCVYFTHHSADYGWWVYDLNKGTIAPGWSNSSPSKKSPVWAEPINMTENIDYVFHK